MLDALVAILAATIPLGYLVVAGAVRARRRRCPQRVRGINCGFCPRCTGKERP